MSNPRTRTIALLAAAVVAVTATLGCGFISAASNVVGNMQTLSDLADKITKSETATSQAEYRLDNGKPVTVAQQPPASAFASDTGRYLATPDAFYLCDKSTGSWVCQKTANSGGSSNSNADAAIAAGVAGNGFVSAPLALAVLTAALVVPSAHVDKSTQKIAGETSTCAKVSGLEQAQQNESQKVSDFTVCVTDSGILARFQGSLTDGTKASIELTKYATTVDSSLLQVPAGAQINDVSQLSATPIPTTT
jgi:hypothetical protein